jgi:hypothetical protein
MVNFVKIIFSLNLWFINPLLTILMINSITICLSYDYIGLFDFTAYNRFAKVKKFSNNFLFYFDLIVHKIPCIIICLWWFILDNSKFYLGDFSGVPSLIINLLWAGFFVKSIDLSDVYVYLPLKVWKKLWILNIFTHLFIGYLINLI